MLLQDATASFYVNELSCDIDFFITASVCFCNHRALRLLGFVILFLLRLVPRSLGRMSNEEHEVRATKKFSFNSATIDRVSSAPVASSPAPVV